jgi:hypothetical protein
LSTSPYQHRLVMWGFLHLGWSGVFPLHVCWFSHGRKGHCMSHRPLFCCRNMSHSAWYHWKCPVIVTCDGSCICWTIDAGPTVSTHCDGQGLVW